MASKIEIQSYNHFLGAMIRAIIANTPLNDVHQGSVLLTILEAAASNDFENNTAILSLLNLLNISTVSGSDLDNRAADFGLTRYAASAASGNITISNDAITKQSTNLYVIKPAPIAGQSVLFVNNTTGWASSGTLYIGRGTTSFEGPIPYTILLANIFPTYTEITLGASLQANHLISDTVINSQGQPDRIIGAGAVIKIPSNNQNPEIDYKTLRDAILEAGEAKVDNVEAIAIVAGSIGNAPINTITQFGTIPFANAGVTNTSAFFGGKDVETDQELRDRTNQYPNTLARGTEAAILAAIQNVSDPFDNKQVASAIIAEPPSIEEPAILYIDDGSGFQPSYAGQSVDTLLSNATSKEEFLQLANFPVTRPQVINTGVGPFTLIDGSYLRVAVDGQTETVIFREEDFVNISAAQITEIIIAINDQAKKFSARLTNNSTRILLYPNAFDAEIIQVLPQGEGDTASQFANTKFQFPVAKFSFISLYQNSNRLREKTITAQVETAGFASWNITAPGNLEISVDNTPEQDRTFSLSSFPGASSFSSLTLTDWVTAFNQQFAGITASATTNQTMLISSNQAGSNSSLEILGGTLLAQLFPTQSTSSTGQTGQFILNRQTGNLKILSPIDVGDSITAGITDAKGFVISTSTTTGLYNLSPDAVGRIAQMIIVPDSTFCEKRSLSTAIGNTITVSNPSGSTMRIMSNSLSAFATILPGDFFFTPTRTAAWLSVNNTGLFKIISKGSHITAGVDTYIDVLNTSITAESVIVADPADLQAFSTDGYPQHWFADFTPTPAVATIDDVVNSLNSDLVNVLATVYQSNAVKITSTTEENGSIAIPVSVGPAFSLFAPTQIAQIGNPSQVANIVSSKSLLTHFKIAKPTLANTFLNRQTFTDSKGALTANAVPDSPPLYPGVYSETVQSTGNLNTNYVDYENIISFTRGNNRDQQRSIAALIVGDQAGTQQALSRTNLDHITGDEFQIVKSLQLSATDSIVVVMDEDPQQNTININMARTGQINSGSNAMAFLPTSTEFSANDADNEVGVDFSTPTVWSTSLNNTNFADYAVWSRARNWYSSGGVGSGLGAMILRADEHGPNGNFLRFNTVYPTLPDQDALVAHVNTPSHTTFSYYFESGAARATALSAGYTISVTGPYPDTTTNFPNGASSSGNYYDYTFSAGVFASVQIDDVLSITAASGVSAANRGQFGIKNISGSTVRVLNTNPGSITAPGAPEVVSVTTIADVLGTPAQYSVTTVADVAGSLDGTYFTVNDTAGITAIWINETGTTAQPFVVGANRYVMIGTILPNDSAVTVATKITNILNQDSAFIAGIALNVITITNVQNGAVGSSSAGTSGFTVSTAIVGTNDSSLSGKYFIIHDSVGSVSVWFDVGNQGIFQPFDGANRGIAVITINPGDSAVTVAAAIQQAVNADSEFSASVLGNVVTITNNFNGNVLTATASTSGFTVSSIDGSNSAPEAIANPVGVTIFPLQGTDTGSISDVINASSVMNATPVGAASLTISLSTHEEIYSYLGNSTALGYGHNPGNPAVSDYVALYDGVNWVKTFANSNPNFILKVPYTLQGVSTIYSMDTAPNFDVTTNGEIFKLIPTTVQNLHHHFTQKALSQLPIVADMNITNDRKNVQIRSKSLGSSGAIEIVGGAGNQSQQYIEVESEVNVDGSGSYLVVKTKGFPNTFNTGDMVLLENLAGVQRLNRLSSTDTMNVLNPSTGIIEYTYNAKFTGISSSSSISITDVSASYGLPAGFVWRWAATGLGINLADVNPGDLLIAYGTLLGWSQNNIAGLTGDTKVSGLPIVSVNITSNYMDVVNPFGSSMGSTVLGVGSTIQVNPTPVIKWSLTHANYIRITSMTSDGSTVSVITSGAHQLNSGNTIGLRDSIFVPDGVYAGITVTSPSTFTFAYVSAPFSELSTHASVILSSSTPTRYRLQSLGFNNLVRLSASNGRSPNFLNCGVAVDDYILIGGSTFSSNNNGRFRVLSVDNNSIIFINSNATDQLNTTLLMNNQAKEATFISNTNTVTGVAGTFKYVTIGSWVKKVSDPNNYFLQVLSLNDAFGVPTTANLAVSITLGGNYLGSDSTAVGTVYDETTGYDQGVYLQGIDDIQIFEGDSVVEGDLLSVQNIVDPLWFNINNTGNRDITGYGTEPMTYLPFVRVTNTSGTAQSGVFMSVKSDGMYITEGVNNKFYSIREVYRNALDETYETNSFRDVYVAPHSRSYKFNPANASIITHIGKMGYSNVTVIGIDGYTYYTGLLQRVQRIVDGFEPDPLEFPGQRAVGSAIETLPPLPHQVNLALDVATNEGVNLGDVSNNIKSTIINYIEGLGVGDPIILSQIIHDVQQVKGVASVVLTNPDPSIPSITISSNEKAIISADNISLA